MRGECENCKKKIPDNQWCCEDCFMLFDGERFLDPDDVGITYHDGFGEEEFEL